MCIYSFILSSMLSLTFSFSTSPPQLIKVVFFGGFFFRTLKGVPSSRFSLPSPSPSSFSCSEAKRSNATPPKNTSWVHPINQIAVKCRAWGKRFSMLGNISYWHQNSHWELFSLIKRGCPLLKPGLTFYTPPCKVWAQYKKLLVTNKVKLLLYDAVHSRPSAVKHLIKMFNQHLSDWSLWNSVS